jgi:hypothetical protein
LLYDSLLIPLQHSFKHKDLIDQRIKQLLQQKKKPEKGWHKYTITESSQSAAAAAGANTTIIPWIEKLLQTPIQDYRKFSGWRILSPYLMNVKRLSYDNAIAY